MTMFLGVSENRSKSRSRSLIFPFLLKSLEDITSGGTAAQRLRSFQTCSEKARCSGLATTRSAGSPGAARGYFDMPKRPGILLLNPLTKPFTGRNEDRRCKNTGYRECRKTTFCHEYFRTIGQR